MSDDGEVAFVEEFGAVDRFALVHVLVRSFSSITWGGNLSAMLPVASSARVVLRCDLVAEEPGLFGPGMGDQGLLGREFQLEVIAQERAQSVLDLLGFSLGPAKPSRKSSAYRMYRRRR